MLLQNKNQNSTLNDFNVYNNNSNLSKSDLDLPNDNLWNNIKSFFDNNNDKAEPKFVLFLILKIKLIHLKLKLFLII